MIICNQLCEYNAYKHGCRKPHSEVCPLNNAVETNHQTEGDRIRAMSDEELAEFLHKVACKFMCEYCKEYERIKAAKGHANCNGECDKAYLVYLKQPAKENKE